MTICLTIANELALNGTYDKLTENLTKYEQDKYMQYLLNEVKKYVIASPEKFKVQGSEISVRTTRLSRSTDLAAPILDANSAINSYINKFWDQVLMRLEYTYTSFLHNFQRLLLNPYSVFIIMLSISRAHYKFSAVNNARTWGINKS